MSFSGDPDSGRYVWFDCTCVSYCDCDRMYCRGCKLRTSPNCYQHGMSQEEREAHKARYERLVQATENFGQV